MDHRFETTPPTFTLVLSGHFTFADNQLFRKILNQVIEKQPQTLVIDFEKLVYIDSAALGMLLLLKERLDEAKIALILKSPKDHVAKMFTVSKFDSLFKIEP